MIICPLNTDPWIRIFLRIWIQEAKMLRIRILSTGNKLANPQYFCITVILLDHWQYLRLSCSKDFISSSFCTAVFTNKYFSHYKQTNLGCIVYIPLKNCITSRFLKTMQFIEFFKIRTIFS